MKQHTCRLLNAKRLLSITSSSAPGNAVISNTTIQPSQSNGLLSDTTYICKDNIATATGFTTAASKSLENYKSPFNATVVSLLSQAGSTLVGKSNLDEFGMGSSNTNSYFGPTMNPIYTEKRIPGGSSGGSAAAVASGLADFSLGTDTGGSIRLPASYCSVIGFKPSYGRISRWGVVPYAQTLDTVGVISKSLDVITKVFSILDVYDEKDPTSLPNSIRKKFNSTSIKGRKLTIGIPVEFVLDELSSESRNAWSQALTKLQSLGHNIKPISIKSITKSLPAYYTLATAEASSNLSRYDGIRYGYSADEPCTTASSLIISNRSESLGPEVQRRIILGNYTLSSDSGDHYLKATKVRQELVQEFSKLFKVNHPLLDCGGGECDLMISPTSIGEAPTMEQYLNEDNANFLNSYVNDILTVPASLAGIPAISIPFGKVGIQLMGQFGDDNLVLQVADTIAE
ncbi:Glutamyl-tRNA [Spathaspora sp. JA1]|nr:Glutamyl-tRNA [Spathaspora sp. JA1]